MPFPNYQGRARFWTRERVISGLELAASELGYPLPCSDQVYLEKKRGRLDWPSINRVYEYFGSLAGAWSVIGIPKSELSFSNIDWTESDETYVLEHAGDYKLESIAKHLGRSYPAVRKRLQKLGITARSNQGFFSAAECSVEYDCSVERVKHLISLRVIEAWYDGRRHRWQVDTSKITPEALQKLREPRKTHKTRPVDKGDYDKRKKLRRHLVDGKVVRLREA